jgi:hypothetical protein
MCSRISENLARSRAGRQLGIDILSTAEVCLTNLQMAWK